MKFLFIFLLSFSIQAKTYKIQVFDKNGKQLYGLYANDSNRAKRLSEAMKLHKEGETTLVDTDITAEEDAKKQARIDRLALIKDANANAKARLQAVIEYLQLDGVVR